MQTHFNENYLESDKYPKSIFVGKVIELKEDNAKVKGLLSIHGVTKEIEASGTLVKKKDAISILSEFKIRLDDFNISIPKIVMYKIAEVISVNIDIELKLTE
jgi:polyisoprenoid-binding protein YceI